MNKRIYSMLLALLLCLSALVGCGGGNEGGDSEKIQYSVTVDVLGARPVAGVQLMFRDAEGNLKRMAATDAQGKTTVTLPKKEGYTVSLAETDGYVAASYPLLEGETHISLTPAIIKDPSLAGVRYHLGSTMHDLTVTTVDGKQWTLSEVLADKKGVFVNLFFTNCGPCKSEMPDIQAAYEKYGEDIAFIAIDPGYVDDDEADVEGFRDAYQLTFDVAYAQTSELASAFGVYSYPTSVFIDRYGTVCLVQRGAVLTKEELAAFDAAFAHFAAEDYKQTLFSTLDEVPRS